MFAPRKITVRPAAEADRNVLAALARFETHVHAHLDWQPIETWLGAQPFLLAELGSRLAGALACPPDPPDTAWLRFFAAADSAQPADLWGRLWSAARAALERAGVAGAAGLVLDEWIEPLYAAAGFQQTHAVVVLSRPASAPPNARCAAAAADAVTIREATPRDHAAVIAADWDAFSPPWQMSDRVLRTAIAQASWLTVAEANGRILGYQLTTPGQEGAHLARLAVLPEAQGRGIGRALVCDLIRHFNRRGIRALTVNTQDSNAASLAVYQRLGFRLTGARYPVYQLALSSQPEQAP